MGEVIELKAHKKQLRKQTARQQTLCREGHHKWQIRHDKQFDSKQGRLVTVYECSRCQARKTRLL